MVSMDIPGFTGHSAHPSVWAGVLVKMPVAAAALGSMPMRIGSVPLVGGFQPNGPSPSASGLSSAGEDVVVGLVVTCDAVVVVMALVVVVATGALALPTAVPLTVLSQP